MARYTGASCRQCRREGMKLFLKGDRCYTDKCAIVKRNYAPGQHGQGRKKLSNYGLQLREKQKAKFIYNVMEKQFRKIYEEAARKLGVTGLTLIEYLERRLENVVYRLGFAKTRRQARQIVSHGHVAVNGRRVNIASYRVKVGDVISIIENSKNLDIIKTSVEDATVPAWLELDRAAFSGKVLQNPTKDDLDFDLNESLIVEFYSR